jgi:hypothetical protein
LLTAEEDRDLVRRHYADQAREKELLGSQTSPYNSDRYVLPPRVAVLGLRGWIDCAVADILQIRTTHIRNHTKSEIKIEGHIKYRDGHGCWTRENFVHITSASYKNAEHCRKPILGLEF